MMNRNKKIIIFALILLTLVFFAMSACKKSGSGEGETVVVTDANGVPVTNENGEAITVVLETEIVEVTNANGEKIYDENGEVKTSVIYHSKDVAVPVTDKDGNVVRDDKGNVLTTMITVPPVTGGPVVTNVVLTDANGRPVIKEDGETVTYTLVFTTTPATPGDNLSNWGTTFGGSQRDLFKATAKTPDGGFIALVQTNSQDGTTAGLADSKATPYSVLIKYDKNGKLKWQKAIAGDGPVALNSIDTDEKGNIIVAGNSMAKDLGFDNYGDLDAVIFKFNSSGDIQWARTIGGTFTESFNGVKACSDGSFVAAGFVYSSDGNIAENGLNIGRPSPVVVKYDANGNTVFMKAYGGSGDAFESVDVDPDGNIYLVGNFSSIETGSLFVTHGKADAAILKLSPDGNLIWNKQYGGKKIDNFPKILALSDGCVIAGRSQSSDFDLEKLTNHGGYDAIVVKFSSDGNLVWNTGFRGYYDDFFNDIKLKPDGSLVAFGYSYSNNRDLKTVGNRGGCDGLIVTFDASGKVTTAQGYGGSKDDMFLSGCVLDSGEYIACGSTLSTDGDLVGSRVLSDGIYSVGMIARFK